MIAQGAGIEVEKWPDRAFDGNREVLLQRLADHGALLSGNLLQIVGFVASDRAFKSGIEIAARLPAGPRHSAIAKFDIADLAVAPDPGRFIEQSGQCGRIRGKRPAAHREAVADQEMAEQPAVDLRQRHHGVDRAAAVARYQIGTGMAEAALHNLAPA